MFIKEFFTDQIICLASEKSTMAICLGLTGKEVNKTKLTLIRKT